MADGNRSIEAACFLPFGRARMHALSVGQVMLQRAVRFVSFGCCSTPKETMLAREAASEDEEGRGVKENGTCPFPPAGLSSELTRGRKDEVSSALLSDLLSYTTKYGGITQCVLFCVSIFARCVFAIRPPCCVSVVHFYPLLSSISLHEHTTFVYSRTCCGSQPSGWLQGSLSPGVCNIVLPPPIGHKGWSVRSTE